MILRTDTDHASVFDSRIGNSMARLPRDEQHASQHRSKMGYNSTTVMGCFQYSA